MWLQGANIVWAELVVFILNFRRQKEDYVAELFDLVSNNQLHVRQDGKADLPRERGHLSKEVQVKEVVAKRNWW